jgi:hypothetical protein
MDIDLWKEGNRAKYELYNDFFFEEPFFNYVTIFSNALTQKTAVSFFFELLECV